MINVSHFSAKYEAGWERLVNDNPSSTLFHSIGWKKVVEKTYGLKPFYLVAEEKGEMMGALPLFIANSLVFGKRLVSVPYAPYGGCLAATAGARSALIAKGAEITRKMNAKYLELRNLENIPDMPSNSHHVTLLLNLGRGESSVWSDVSSNMRSCIKKASKVNFRIDLDSKDIAKFYGLYRRRMHELGTPVQPVSFFKNIMEYFPASRIATVDLNGELLGCQFLLFFKKCVIYGWGASSKQNSDSYPFHLLVWSVIQDCIARRYEVYDFGRSALDSGTYEFKRRFGAQPRPLFYQYFLNKEKEVPDVHPSNPRYGFMINAWKKIPSPIVNWLGPVVSRELV